MMVDPSCVIAPNQVREDVLKKKQLDTRQQTYDAISTSLSLLDDPFTRLLDPGRYAALQRGTGGGAITGVGLEVAFEEGKGAASELVVRTWLVVHLAGCLPGWLYTWCCRGTPTLFSFHAPMHLRW